VPTSETELYFPEAKSVHGGDGTESSLMHYPSAHSPGGTMTRSLALAIIAAISLSLAASLSGSARAQTRDQNRQRCADVNPDISISGCTGMIQSGQETSANLAIAYYNRATADGDKGEYDLAHADYNQSIQLQPDDADAFTGRCYVYFKEGQFDQAIADLNESIQLMPDDADAFYNRGNAYSSKGEYDNAIADFTSAIQFGHSAKHAILATRTAATV
jgi:tetratricopeptide (TPR) repeat protein